MSSTGDDDRVQAGIGEEGGIDLPIEDERDEAGDDQEDDHPPKIDLGSGELVGVVLPRAASAEKQHASRPSLDGLNT